MHRHVTATTVVGPVRAEVVTTEAGLEAAVELLEHLEAAAGLPLVDESERDRLRPHGRDRPEAEHWHALLATRDGAATPEGYAGIVLTPGADAVVGDVAVDRRQAFGDTLAALLAALSGLAAEHGADEATVWIRHADVTDVACARGVGWQPVRHLDVLRLQLRDTTAVVGLDLAGFTLRTWAGEDDDRAVAAVLAAAYAGSPESGWDAEKVRQRRQLPWFRGEDLLLAADDDTGDVVGVHWTKRRDEVTGEVYNLAVDPRTQGTGLGRALLRAGTAHLAAVGMREVVLWVDRENTRARRLYDQEGFSLAWTDLALSTRPLADQASPSSGSPASDSRREPGGTTL